MPSQKDTILGKLAVERGYLTQEQLDEAFEIQRKMHDELGVDQPLEQVLTGKHWLTPDQAQELRHAAAVKSGEARLVAGYEVISKLGQGGMGAVYKAKHPTSGEYVALKVLPPTLADERTIARFKRESEIVKRLDHENIMSFVEFGRDSRRNCWFCALELIEGEDLRKRIKRLGVLSEDEAVSIIRQIAQALQHAHFNGLVHRDVKPENIMVTRQGTAKLLDLGLARPASMEATRMTQSGMFVGSPYYCSPEQAMGEKEIDIRTDVYSLGATLYHCVTGKPPFGGTTVLQVLQRHVSETLPWPAEINPELSDGICRVIAKMMAKKPAERYQVPIELLHDLDMLSHGGSPEITDEAIHNSSVKLHSLRRGSHRGPPGAGDRRGRRRRRHEEEPDQAASWKSRVGVAAMMLGVVALVGVMGMLLLREEKPKVKPKEKPAEPPRPEPALARKEPVRGARRAPPSPGDTSPVKVPEPVSRSAPSRDTGPTGEVRGSAELAEVKVSPPRADTRIVSPEPPPTPPPEPPDPAEAYRAALAYERANPTDRAGVITRFETIARDFPGTSQGRMAEVNLIRLRDVSPGRATAVEPVPTENAKLASILSGFDALLDKGDYAGARKHMERAAAGGEAELAGVVRAGMQVAGALEARKQAIRRAAQALVGKETELRTEKGKLGGKVEGVYDDAIVLSIKKKLRGMGTIETRMRLKWADLAPEEEDRFARKGGWKAVGPDAAVARAHVALARKDERAALAAIKVAGDHPLVGHYRAKMEARRREPAARAAWSGIQGKARAKKLSSAEARSLGQAIAAFEKRYGGTEFAASVAGKLAEFKARAGAASGVAMVRGLLGTYYKGRNLQEPLLRRIDPQVNFKWGHGLPAPGVPDDDFSVRWEGFIVPPATGEYTLHLSADRMARLWVDGRQILAVSKDEGLRASEPLALETGKVFPVRLEHYEHHDSASVKLLWTGPGIPKPVPVPARCLRPPADYEKRPGPPLRK